MEIHCCGSSVRRRGFRARSALLASSALSAAALAMLLADPQAALANCDVTGSATPSGTNSLSCAVNTTTVNATNSNGATASSNAQTQSFSNNGALSASISSGVTVDGRGLNITNSVGALTFTNDGAVISTASSTSGLALATNGGLITYTGNGNITGAASASNGLLAQAQNGGSVSINTGTGTISTLSGNEALVASATGAGTVSVSTSGTVSNGGASQALFTSSVDGLTTINVNGGSVAGIAAASSGAGGIQINVNAGSVAPTGAGVEGINIDSTSTGTIDVSIAAGTTVDSARGIGLRVIGGTGAVTITVLGTLSSNPGTAADFRGTLNVGTGGTSGTLADGVSMQDSATLLKFNRSDNVTYTGAINGAGNLQQTGGGTLTLTAFNSNYTGATTITGPGSGLIVNGSIDTSSGLMVNTGTFVGGTGRLPSTVIASGAMLAPGNSVGTIAVQGNLTFNAGGIYAVEFSPSAADRTNVSGAATLTGATVQATALPGSFRGQSYTIVNATGGVTGSFAGLTVTGAALGGARNPHLTYDANNVYLVLDQGSIQLPAGTSGNAAAAAGGINNAVNGGATPPAGFDALLNMSGTQLTNALTQVSGEGGNGATLTTAYNATNQFIGTIIDPSIDGRGADAGAGGATGYADDGSDALAYSGKRKATPAERAAYAAVTPRETFAGRWSVWASGYGGSARVEGNATAGTHSTSSSIYGTAVGADYRIGRDTLIGIAMGGAGVNFNTAQGLGGGRADLFQLGVYGRHNIGAAYIAGALAYGWQDVTLDRTVTVAGADHLRSNFNTNTFAARAEAGYRFATALMGVTPYAALQVTTVHLPSYTEAAVSGSNQFALAFPSDNSTNVRTELGLRGDKAFAMRDSVLTLRGRAAFAHDSNTDRVIAPTFQTLPGSAFTVNGARPSPDGALITAGAEMKWRNGWAVAGTFEGEFSRTTESYAGRGTVKYAW